jgi:hypothetical protein
MRPILMALSLALLAVSPARAEEATLNHLIQEKFQVAEDFEIASFASEKCPGLHVIEAAVIATSVDTGVTLDDLDVIHSPEYEFWTKRGRMNARIGYEKGPAAWCESMWHFLGPDHPPMINRALLERQ